MEDSGDLLARFIRSRWQSPNRALKSIRIGPSYRLGHKEDFETLTGPLEPVARCVEEGLQFEVRSERYL